MSKENRSEIVSAKTQSRYEALRRLWSPVKNLSTQTKIYVGMALLSFLTTFFIANPFGARVQEVYREGEIVRQSIISPADISVVDEDRTEETRRIVADSIRPFFSYEPNRAEMQVKNFRSLWDELQKPAANNNANSAHNLNQNTANRRVNTNLSNEYADFSRLVTGSTISNSQLDLLTNILRETASGQIYADENADLLQGEILLIDRANPNRQQVITMPQATMTRLSTARSILRERLGEIKVFSSAEAQTIYNAMASFIQPSVQYDAAATNRARADETAKVAEIRIELKRGEVIARAGDVVTSEVVKKVQTVSRYGSTTRFFNKFLGLFLLIGGLYWIIFKFIELRYQSVRLPLPLHRTFILVGAVIVISAMLYVVGFQVADFAATQNAAPPFNDTMSWGYLLPFGAAALIIAALVDAPTAFLTAIFCSLVAGFIAPKGLEFAVFSFASSSSAIYGISRYRTRQAVTWAGIYIAFANILAALAFIGYMQQPLILGTILLAVICAVGGAFVTAAVAAVLLPIAENTFGILSDVKLLELSNAELPVLGQLALRTPGTNQHSHGVGQLAYDGCTAIGANALLVRIAALYHDIGKLAAPEYFVENQQGVNPHDRLRPEQSAKIIISHVTYGLKLAKELRLPQQIIDFIPQHHGSRTLHYFLQKAQANCENPEEIDESDFRYPGPKPQTKEAAVMMIADSCEAATRSLAQPSPENIRIIVNRIIDAILADDQLDESDLTLRELTTVREAMIKSLVSIYHQRIDYPGFNPPEPASEMIHISAPADQRQTRYANAADIPISKGGEVEEEAVEHSAAPNKK